MKKKLLNTTSKLILATLLTGCSTLKRVERPSLVWGEFKTPIKTEWLPGREMKLLEDVRYISPEGQEWIAPAGKVVDGASIPKAFWSVLGGPYEGSYRDASVIHDSSCKDRTETWEAVHYMFYTAMRAKGVTEDKAKIMYAAVYRFGPRWKILNTKAVRTPTSTDVKKVETYVETYHPSISKIQTTESIPGAPTN